MKNKKFYHAVNNAFPRVPNDLFAKRDLLRHRPFFWSSFTLGRIRSAVELHRFRGTPQPFDDVEPVADLPAQRRNSKSRKDKGVAFEAVSGDHPQPGWDPSFTPGERGGTSAAPPPSEFFDDLPPAFMSDELLDNEERRKVTADGSRLVNEVRPLNSDHIIVIRCTFL